MVNVDKSKEAYKTIGEVTKELGLIDKKTGRMQTHTIRYWETQFKQIKPVIRAGKRRYYSSKVFKVFGPIPPSATVPIIFCNFFAARPVPEFTAQSNTAKSKPDGK